MDHLFEFTNDLTKEFFRLVTQEGVTSYDEDDGRLATLAVKNVLAGRDFTMVQTKHHYELVDRQLSLVEEELFDGITRRYHEMADGGKSGNIAIRAISAELNELGYKIMTSTEYSRLISARVLPSPRILAEIVDRYNKIKAESPGANHHTLAMDAITHVLAKDGLETVETESYERVLKELADREQIAANTTVVSKEPPVVTITKEGVVHEDEGIIVKDYRKGDTCVSCENFFLFENLLAVYKADDRGFMLTSSKYHVCVDCGPEDSSIPS